MKNLWYYKKHLRSKSICLYLIDFRFSWAIILRTTAVGYRNSKRPKLMCLGYE